MWSKSVPHSPGGQTETERESASWFCIWTSKNVDMTAAGSSSGDWASCEWTNSKCNGIGVGGYHHFIVHVPLVSLSSLTLSSILRRMDDGACFFWSVWMMVSYPFLFCGFATTGWGQCSPVHEPISISKLTPHYHSHLKKFIRYFEIVYKINLWYIKKKKR